MSFLTDRDAVFNVLKNYRCIDAQKASQMNTYDQLVEFFLEGLEIMTCMKNEVSELLAIFDDAQRISYGIYKDKTGITITNPVVVEGCTGCVIEINNGSSNHRLSVFTSQIDKIFVDANTTLEYALISRGSVIDMITITEGSRILYLSIKSCERDQTTVTLIDGPPDSVDVLIKEPVAIFGGFQCNPIIPV